MSDELGEDTQLGEIVDRRKNSDRRRALRRKTLKGGQTFWPNGDSSECIVCNLSETGACLALRGPAPKLFDLVVEGDTARRPCCVVWRKGNRVGVKFQQSSRSASTTGNPPKRVTGFRQFAEQCQLLAKRATDSDRERLLEMAEAWLSVARRLKRKYRPDVG
jgi:PilZ domain